MICVILGTLLFKSVSSEIYSERYGSYGSPKHYTLYDAYSSPYKTQDYNEIGDEHGTLNEFDRSVSEYKSKMHSKSPKNYYSYDLKKYNSYVPYSDQHYPVYPTTFTTSSAKHSYYPIDKAKQDYEISRRKSEAEYERMKSLMHYALPEDTDKGIYDPITFYSIDDDDLRTSPRNYYTSWPYFSFETINDIKETNVRPVRQGIIPFYDDYETKPVTESPIYDDKFLSSIAKDYYDKETGGDALVFNEFDKWAQDFDYNPHYGTHEEKKASTFDFQKDKQPNSLTGYQNYISQKNKNKDHHYSNSGNGKKKKENNKSEYKDNGIKYDAEKNYKDSFKNKFGGEDQSKKSKYLLKTDQDQGEKRKGFRRVYHKDEYQEDNEFYDNKNKKAKSEEFGGSNAHSGGSHAVVQSHATAGHKEDAKAYDRSGNNENESFENEFSGYDKDNHRFSDMWHKQRKK